MKHPMILLNLSKYPKTNTNSSSYMEEIQNILQANSNYKHIYLDDSNILDSWIPKPQSCT